MNTQPVYILSAKRTAIGSFMGGLAAISAPRIAAHAISAAVQSAHISGELIEQAYLGCVLPANVGQAPARQAVLYAELPKSVACTTVNKVCGSGMKAIMLGAQSILNQDCEVALVGGMENMSQAPFYIENARSGFRMGHQKMIDGMIKDGLWDPYNDFHMGNAAELCVKEKNFSRQEQDRFAIQSFERAQAAIKEGKFNNEIAPVTITGKKGDVITIATDEGPMKAQFDKMAKLNPAFQKDGTITAANASTINDGAAALILASESFVKKHNLKPMAKIIATAEHAQAPEWFTTAPVDAMKKVLAKAKLTVNQIDLFEINEAFAVVAMAAQQALAIDNQKLNVHGGAISLGHPIGASGARIVVTLLHALQMYQKKIGLASICIGGGEATALIVERLG